MPRLSEADRTCGKGGEEGRRKRGKGGQEGSKRRKEDKVKVRKQGTRGRMKRTDWKQRWEKTKGREDTFEERSRGTQESVISELEEELKKQTRTWGIGSETGEGT